MNYIQKDQCICSPKPKKFSRHINCRFVTKEPKEGWKADISCALLDLHMDGLHDGDANPLVGKILDKIQALLATKEIEMLKWVEGLFPPEERALLKVRERPPISKEVI